MKTAILNKFLFSTLFLWSLEGYTQDRLRDFVNASKKALQTQKEDTNKVNLLTRVSDAYSFNYPDTALVYAQQAIDLAEKINFERGILNANRSLIRSLTTLGNFPLALDFGFKAHTLAKKIGSPRDLIFATGNLAQCYFYLGDYNTSLKYFRDIVKIVKESYPDSLGFIWGDISKTFEAMNQSDSALLYAKESYKVLKRWKFADRRGYIYFIVGNAFASNGNYDSALFYYKIGVPISIRRSFAIHKIDLYNGIAKAYKATANLDSAIWYSRKVLSDKSGNSYPNGSLKAANMLTVIYEAKNMPDSTLKYLQIAIGLKDSLFNREKTIAIQNLTYKEQEKQKELAESKLKLRNQFIMYFLVAVFIAALVIVSIVLRNNRQKQLQNMRNSIADDLHDDIGSTLSSISILNELAKEKSPEAISLLDSIGENTLSIQENMSDIVWSLNAKNDRFENVLHRMNQFASEIFEAKNIELDFTSDAGLLTLRLTMKQRKNLYLFFKEAINNAAKHSDARKISVHIFQNDHHVEMIIRDDGKGFDTSQTFHGNGMSTLKKRIEELRGYLKIQSQLNEGTVVALKFKIT
jgi:two-component system sensor histidine kinase UhpB